MIRRLKLTYPTHLIDKPLIYLVGKQFDVVTNIRRANVERDTGWVVLELDGERDQVEAAEQWLAQQGVTVVPVEGDLFEG